MNSRRLQNNIIPVVSFAQHPGCSQFVSLAIAQLSGRNSLRDIVENMSAQAHRLYHIGNSTLSRSNLSRINEEKPYTLYEALFGTLLARCQRIAPTTLSVLNIHCIHWMLLALICDYRCFLGLTFVRLRVLSNSMLD